MFRVFTHKKGCHIHVESETEAILEGPPVKMLPGGVQSCSRGSTHVCGVCSCVCFSPPARG